MHTKSGERSFWSRASSAPFPEKFVTPGFYRVHATCSKDRRGSPLRTLTRGHRGLTKLRSPPEGTPRSSALRQQQNMSLVTSTVVQQVQFPQLPYYSQVMFKKHPFTESPELKLQDGEMALFSNLEGSSLPVRLRQSLKTTEQRCLWI